MVSTSGISIIVLPSDSNELCDGLQMILLEKHAGNKSNTVNEKIVAILINNWNTNAYLKNSRSKF